VVGKTIAAPLDVMGQEVVVDTRNSEKSLSRTEVVVTFTRITALLLRSPAGHGNEPACGAQMAAGPPALEVERRSISLRTAGATSVPNSSMACITFSCGSAPTLICAIKRLWLKSSCS
jgi:hypothetical protein